MQNIEINPLLGKVIIDRVDTSRQGIIGEYSGKLLSFGTMVYHKETMPGIFYIEGKDFDIVDGKAVFK